MEILPKYHGDVAPTFKETELSSLRLMNVKYKNNAHFQ